MRKKWQTIALLTILLTAWTVPPLHTEAVPDGEGEPPIWLNCTTTCPK